MTDRACSSPGALRPPPNATAAHEALRSLSTRPRAAPSSKAAASSPARLPKPGTLIAWKAALTSSPLLSADAGARRAGIARRCTTPNRLFRASDAPLCEHQTLASRITAFKVLDDSGAHTGTQTLWRGVSPAHLTRRGGPAPDRCAHRRPASDISSWYPAAPLRA